MDFSLHQDHNDEALTIDLYIRDDTWEEEIISCIVRESYTVSY